MENPYMYGYSQGPSLLKNFGGDKFWLFAFRWRHHVHSTVVRPFCKIGKMGTHCGIYIFWLPWPKCLYGYAHGGGRCYI